MGKLDLAGLAEPLLKPGEEVLGAVRVNWNGMVPPTQASRAMGLAGLGVPGVTGEDGDEAAVEPAPPDPDTLVVFPSAKQLALVLTGGRILAWSLGFSGKPKDLIGTVPVSAVEEVSLKAGRASSVLRIVMRSGAIVDLEGLRGEPIDDFHAQLQHLISI